ncbi:MAG: type I methionyl aminopeptidase [Bacteroidales bacterium]
MISFKTKEEIELLQLNGDLVSKTLAEVGRHIGPGVKTIELDKIAETFIRDHDAEPAFLGYGGFPYTLCISVNEAIVHGFPSNYVLKEGDIVSIDCGTKYKGFYGDSAYTFSVGEIGEENRRLLEITKESLYLGLEQSVRGNRVGDISYAVQRHAEAAGFSVVREMVGHGIGKRLHEKPEVPNFGNRGVGKKLQNGMVFCVEPMINAGGRAVILQDDGWTLTTQDGKNSAHFELMVAVENNTPKLLSTFKFIEETKS